MDLLCFLFQFFFYFQFGNFEILPVHLLLLCQKLRNLWHFQIFANIGPYWHGAGNFQKSSPTAFIRCQPNFMRTLPTMGIQLGINFWGNWPTKFKIFLARWNFNMGVNGKMLKCAMSWKGLTVEQNGCHVKFVTHGPRNSTCRVLSVQVIWVQFWVIQRTLQNFWCFRFSKGCCSHSFHPVSTKLYSSMCMYSGEIKAVNFSGYVPNFKSTFIWHFEDKLPQLHCQYLYHLYKAVLVSSGKRSADDQGPWASCFHFSKFWILTNLFSILLTWDPMGVKISKCCCSYSYNSFWPIFF